MADRVPGHPNLSYKGGRPSMLRDPNFVTIVAELIASGKSHRVICEELQDQEYDVRDPETISRWKKDARVKLRVQEINEQRAIDISRKVDSQIMGILSDASRLSIKELVMIRKEFGGTTLGKNEIVPDSVTEEMMKALSGDNAAEELAKLLAQNDEVPAVA